MKTNRKRAGIPHVVSAWKNPYSKMFPLSLRERQSSHAKLEVNFEAFERLKKALDEI